MDARFLDRIRGQALGGMTEGKKQIPRLARNDNLEDGGMRSPGRPLA